MRSVPVVLAIAFSASALADVWFTGLGDLPQGRTATGATGVSADGRVVVGWGSPFSQPGPNYRAVRWEGGVLTDLGDLPGGQMNGFAWAISGDGNVIAGQGSSDPFGSGEAAVWQN